MARSPANSDGVPAPPPIRKVVSARVRSVGRIRRKELPSFTRRLAAMLDAGLPLIQCLEALGQQTQIREFGRVINALRQRVEGGDSFAEALARYDRLFGELYVNMVRAGEFGGSLSEVMNRLASYLEASAALRRRIIAAVMYPVIIMILATTLTTCMLVFIVPSFEEIYNDFDAKLPKPTLVLIFISKLIRERALWVIAGVVLLLFIFFRVRRSEKGGLAIDKAFLKIPVFGGLMEKIALARFSRTFASLMRSGVPILRSVQIVSTATGNRYIGRSLAVCGPEIEGGSNIAAAMGKTGSFPPMIIHMISVGEKTGNIDGMLEKIADFYEDEVTNALEALSSMIEPMLMAILGVLIGGIVIAMFMPIFNLHQLIAT